MATKLGHCILDSMSSPNLGQHHEKSSNFRRYDSIEIDLTAVTGRPCIGVVAAAAPSGASCQHWNSRPRRAMPPPPPAPPLGARYGESLSVLPLSPVARRPPRQHRNHLRHVQVDSGVGWSDTLTNERRGAKGRASQ